MISTEDNVNILNLPVSTFTELTSDSKHYDYTDILKRKRIRIIKKNHMSIEKLRSQGFRTGKWDHSEHMQFLKACLTHGNNWARIREELKTRSSAQIRSHAQKFIIKLCKKYQIKIKSKKFKKKFPRHLDIINKNKTFQIKEMDIVEKKYLDIFNYYNREYKPFKIEKIHKCHDGNSCKNDIRNKKTTYLIKNKIFIITKNKKENSDIYKETHKLKKLNVKKLIQDIKEFNKKIGFSNNNIFSSDYNYESNNKTFPQSLMNSLYCISTNVYDYNYIYNIYSQYYHNFNEDMRKLIYFWENFFEKRDKEVNNNMRKILQSEEINKILQDKRNIMNIDTSMNNMNGI